MDNKEKDLLADLFCWIQEGLEDKSLNEVSSLSGFEFNESSDRKRALKKELAFFYLFTAHSYCKSQKIPSQSTNILFNLVHSKIFEDEERIKWFELLNDRIQDYTKFYCSEKAGKLFGVTGLFLLLLRESDNSFMPGLSYQTQLIEYFKNKIELLPRGLWRVHKTV